MEQETEQQKQIRKVEEEKHNKRVEEETSYFHYNIVPFGSSDVKATIETSLEAGKSGDWVAEQIQEYCDSTETQLKNIDVVYCVYDALLQEARNEISQATNKDILNDLSPSIEVYGNYMCTSFDCSQETAKKTLNLALKVKKEDRSKTLNWFIDKLKEMI